MMIKRMKDKDYTDIARPTTVLHLSCIYLCINRCNQDIFISVIENND